MNKDKLKELLDDLHDGTFIQNGIVEIPNGERVIEEAHRTGYQLGWQDCARLLESNIPNKSVRSEPTTGAGLVKEMDDCIKLATERSVPRVRRADQESDKKGLWVCSYATECDDNQCPQSMPHIPDRACGRYCSEYSGPNYTLCIPYGPDDIAAKSTAFMKQAIKGLGLE